MSGVTDTVKEDFSRVVSVEKAESIEIAAKDGKRRILHSWLLARASLLAILSIASFAYLSWHSMEIHQGGQSVVLECNIRGLSPSEPWCKHNMDESTYGYALAIVWAVLAIGLAVLLILELLTSRIGKKWELPASSLAIVSAGSLILYCVILFKWVLEWGRFSPCSSDPLPNSSIWIFIALGFLFFGIGFIKLPTLTGPYRWVAVVLFILNGLLAFQAFPEMIFGLCSGPG